MLNQCILIGRIKETHRNQDGVIERFTIEVNTGTNTDLIMIDTHRKMASYGLFSEGSIIAIKARVSSGNAIDYQFIADRITVLRGNSHES